MPALKNIMRDYTLFVDGTLFSADVESVNTPKLSWKTDEYRGGGMDMGVDVPLGMDKIEIEFDLSSHDELIYETYGLATGATKIFKVYAHLISHGGAETGVEIDCTGFIKSVDPGAWKPGSKSTAKVHVSCDYYKHVIGSRAIIEVDAFQKVFKVNGVDRNATARQYLGL